LQLKNYGRKYVYLNVKSGQGIEELIIMHTTECICITFQEYEVYHDQLNVYETTSTSVSFVDVFIKSTWYLKPCLQRTLWKTLM
jgi:hypothetical protein